MRIDQLIRIWAIALTLAAGIAIAAGNARADAGSPEPLSAFPRSLLAIRTASGRVINFKIWLADTPRRDEQGLMFVRDIDDHAGMLFLFQTGDQVTMWMKNTYMPLDMVFIDDHARIAHIAKRTTPLSLDLISAPGPTRAVLELKGGISDRFGIRVGDRVLQRDLSLRH